MNSNILKWMQEYNIDKIIDAYDVLNLVYGKQGLLPTLSEQEKAIDTWATQNNAYVYRYNPKYSENKRWAMQEAHEQGKTILVLDMQG